VVAAALLAILFAPCPDALAALGGPDPHACCDKTEQGEPAAPDCETMCARDEAERAAVVAPPADGSAVELAPVRLGEMAASVAPALLQGDSSPPGSLDVRLLSCIFLI